MIIDCDRCDMQDTRACDDCIVTALLPDGEERGILELADDERSAIDELSKVGLVSPLRLRIEPDRRQA